MVSFAEPARLSFIFDAEDREQWQKSSAILQRMALQPEMVVADIGAGTGYFSRLFALTLSGGCVHAIDCEPNMVAHMQQRFAREGLANVSVHLSRVCDPCLPEIPDWVFLANVYRFIQEREVFLRRLLAQMGQQTRGLLVDFKGAQAAVSPTQARAEVQQAGFVVDELDLQTCPDHYLLHFHKPAGC
ncbi:MAG: class I SAM-dependent methyltransferase [Aeromonadaceae bacterium]